MHVHIDEVVLDVSTAKMPGLANTVATALGHSLREQKVSEEYVDGTAQAVGEAVARSVRP